MTRGLSRICLFALAAALAAPAARAQEPAPAGAPVQSILPGQNANKDKPIQIESKTLEVQDKKKIATFSGDVQVVQGDTTMKCNTLVVFYGPEPGSTPAKAKPPEPKIPPAPKSATSQSSGMPQNQQDIRKIEARGDVTVVTKDQSASGDLGVYDPKAKTITLTGSVVVSQGQNVIRGDRVVVDTETGYSRVESTATTQNRVRALIIPKKSDTGGGSSSAGGNGGGGLGNMLTIGPGRSN